MNIRKATIKDIDAVAGIYSNIHTAEENGLSSTGWERGVYPTRSTAEDAVSRGDLFVMEDEGSIVGAATINQMQVDVYSGAPWEYDAPDNEVMVIHTLVVNPNVKGRGYGRNFVKFYEDYALEHGCKFLRIDTNERNSAARGLYGSLAYKEIGIVPCVFNGLENVNLVLLEKKL